MLPTYDSSWIEVKLYDTDEPAKVASVYKLTITTQRSKSVKWQIVFPATGEETEDTDILYNSRESAYKALKGMGYRKGN